MEKIIKDFFIAIGYFFRGLGYKIQPDFWQCMDYRNCNYRDYLSDKVACGDYGEKQCPKCRGDMIFKVENF